MDQTRFDLMQSTREIITELYMASGPRREAKGEQFAATLMVEMSDGSTQPLDIDMYRVPLEQDGRAFEAVDGTVVIATMATIDGGAPFAVNVIIEPRTLKEGSPFVRIAPEMGLQLVEWLDRTDADRTEHVMKDIDAFLNPGDDASR